MVRFNVVVFFLFKAQTIELQRIQTERLQNRVDELERVNVVQQEQSEFAHRSQYADFSIATKRCKYWSNHHNASTANGICHALYLQTGGTLGEEFKVCLEGKFSELSTTCIHQLSCDVSTSNSA
jgi:hypothetical protein